MNLCKENVISLTNAIIVVSNSLTMGRIVIPVGANIIAADRNATTVGVSVITTGRDVILGNKTVCTYSWSYIKKWPIIIHGANNKLKNMGQRCPGKTLQL